MDTASMDPDWLMCLVNASVAGMVLITEGTLVEIKEENFGGGILGIM